MSGHHDYNGPYTGRDADRDAWDVCEASCRAVATLRGVRYPIPPGLVHGFPPADLLTNPGKYSTWFLTPPEELKGGSRELFILVTDEMKRVSPDKVDVRGRMVDPARSGTEMSDDDFKKEPPPERPPGIVAEEPVEVKR